MSDKSNALLPDSSLRGPEVDTDADGSAVAHDTLHLLENPTFSVRLFNLAARTIHGGNDDAKRPYDTSH